MTNPGGTGGGTGATGGTPAEQNTGTGAGDGVEEGTNTGEEEEEGTGSGRPAGKGMPKDKADKTAAQNARHPLGGAPGRSKSRGTADEGEE